MIKILITIGIFGFILATAFFLGVVQEMTPFINNVNENTFAYLSPETLFLIGFLVFVLVVGLVSTFT